MQTVLSFPEFQTCMAMLVAATNRPMQDAQVNVYYELLQDIPVAALQSACARAIQEQKDTWLPSIGLIRSFASEAINGSLPDAAEAFDRVHRIVVRYGYYRKAEGLALMSPMERQALMGIGGWDAIGDSENISIVMGQFKAVYLTLAKREQGMRQISAELRPLVTAGPTVAPRLSQQPPASTAARHLADKLPRIELEATK